MSLHAIDRDRRLYIMLTNFATLGFDVAEKRARAVLEWLPPAMRLPLTTVPGTRQHFEQYEAIMRAGKTHALAQRDECLAGLTPQLIGLEGKRIEVKMPDDTIKRFYVGKSKGWMPCHLELRLRNAKDGNAVDIPKNSSIRVIG